MNKELKLTYGKEKISLSIPDDFLAGDLIKPKKSTNKMSEPEMKEKMTHAIKNPIDSPKVSEMVGDAKVGLVISDEFRSGLQELVISIMTREIFKGNPERLDVFIANGTHDPKVYCKNLAATIKEISKDSGHEVRVIVNECDSEEYISLGKTTLGTDAQVSKEWLKTEVRIYAHESKYHYMNGYSVVDKQVCPGLCSRKTIASTHKHALKNDLSAAGRIAYHQDESRRENPFAQDNRDVRKLSERYILKGGELKEENVSTFLLICLAKIVY